MKPKWLIEHVFDEDCRNLIDSLEKEGTEYKIVSNPIYEGKWKRLYAEEDCVITYGSIQFGNLINREAKWIPGHYGTFQNYLCSVYYPHFKDHLLNNEYMFLPFSTLLDKEDFIFDTFGEQDAVFIRPDSGNKTFTGKLVYKERFKREVELFGLYDPKPESMCLISTPKNIEKEWRFFVVNGRIVCGSVYKPGRHSIYCDYRRSFTTVDCLTDDDIASTRAIHIVNNLKWQPDPVWCLDICKTRSGDFYVLEIGSFASAGLYACNTLPLVQEVNRVALKEWLEYYN